MKPYRCHKIVEAAKIVSIEKGTVDTFIVELDGGQRMRVGTLIFARGMPSAGDYMVRYHDGYLSWSPGEAFEDGYTLVEN